VRAQARPHLHARGCRLRHRGVLPPPGRGVHQLQPARRDRASGHVGQRPGQSARLEISPLSNCVYVCFSHTRRRGGGCPRRVSDRVAPKQRAVVAPRALLLDSLSRKRKGSASNTSVASIVRSGSRRRPLQSRACGDNRSSRRSRSSSSRRSTSRKTRMKNARLLERGSPGARGAGAGEYDDSLPPLPRCHPVWRRDCEFRSLARVGARAPPPHSDSHMHPRDPSAYRTRSAVAPPRARSSSATAVCRPSAVVALPARGLPFFSCRVF
jgi:hypothetical protein